MKAPIIYLPEGAIWFMRMCAYFGVGLWIIAALIAGAVWAWRQWWERKPCR